MSILPGGDVSMRTHMLRRLLLTVGVVAVLAGVAFLLQKPTSTVSLLSAADESPGSVAVVELFTSEGCSSCPSADALLGLIETESKKQGQPVYCLSFHVDYWDRLGWKDPYSEESITQRQTAYSRHIGLKHNYTPQMIVNGTDQFLGSDRKLAVAALRKAFAEVAPVTIDLSVAAKDREINVNCQVRNAPQASLLCVAWVNTPVPSSPNRGENQGRQLPHVNVVRDFQTIELTPDFDGKITLKRSSPESGLVIAFVQEAGPGKVLGAKSTPLTAE